MFWYIVICILMIYPLGIIWAGKVSGKKTERVALFSACLILWFFMAMRGVYVGVDTKYYSYVFSQFDDIPLSEIFTAATYATESETWTFDFEPGYRLLNKLVSFVSVSPQAITIVNSTLIIVLLYKLICKNSPDVMLSVWLFITLGIFQTEMNVTRNAIAILLVYNALPYIHEKKFWKYVFICLAASSFHISAIAFIPLYWLLRNTSLTIKKCVLLIVGFSLTGIFFSITGPFIRMIMPSAFDRYFVVSNEKMVSLMIGILNAGVFCICYMLLNRGERKRVFAEYSIGVCMLLMNVCFFGLNIGLGQASRMAALFGPYLIIFIPQVLSLIESDIRKKDATVLVVVLCGMQYIARLCINNIGGTMPYYFFW